MRTHCHSAPSREINRKCWMVHTSMSTWSLQSLEQAPPQKTVYINSCCIMTMLLPTAQQTQLIFCLRGECGWSSIIPNILHSWHPVTGCCFWTSKNCFKDQVWKSWMRCPSFHEGCRHHWWHHVVWCMKQVVQAHREVCIGTWEIPKKTGIAGMYVSLFRSQYLKVYGSPLIWLSCQYLINCR